MGVIHSEDFDGSSSLPAGWSSPDAIWSIAGTTGGVAPTSAPYLLEATPAASGLSFFTWGTGDGNSGDVTLWCDVDALAGTGNPGIVGVFVRGSGTGDAITGYSAWIHLNTYEVGISRWSAGAETQLSTTSPLVGPTTWGTLVFTASGSSLSVAIQDRSTGDWLSGTSYDSATQVDAVTATDATIAGAGTSGVYCKATAGGGFDALFDTWWLGTAGSSPTGPSATPPLPAARPASSPRRPRAGSARFAVQSEPDPPSRVIRSASPPPDRRGFRRGAVQLGNFAPIPFSDQQQTPLIWQLRPFSRPSDRRREWTPGLGRLVGVGPRLPDPIPRAVAIPFVRRIEDLPRRRRGAVWTPCDPQGGVVVVPPLPFPSGLWYLIYSNGGAAAPDGWGGYADTVSYGSAIAQTQATAWTSAPLAPGPWEFGVRAADADGEELNQDAYVLIVLDTNGNDITDRPPPPTGLRLVQRPAGTLRAEWHSPDNQAGPTAPTGFHVYLTAGGAVSYAAPAATVLYSAGIRGYYAVDFAGLTDGQLYSAGVRAFNASGEEANTAPVSATADGTGPAAVDLLVATTIV